MFTRRSLRFSAHIIDVEMRDVFAECVCCACVRVDEVLVHGFMRGLIMF